MKNVVSPPRTSRETVDRRALTSKKRSSPFFGRGRGPSLRRGTVVVPATTSAGEPPSPVDVALAYRDDGESAPQPAGRRAHTSPGSDDA